MRRTKRRSGVNSSTWRKDPATKWCFKFGTSRVTTYKNRNLGDCVLMIGIGWAKLMPWIHVSWSFQMGRRWVCFMQFWMSGLHGELLFCMIGLNHILGSKKIVFWQCFSCLMVHVLNLPCNYLVRSLCRLFTFYRWRWHHLVIFAWLSGVCEDAFIVAA